MAFRKKADVILACKPDILIVPECEHPDKLKFENETQKPNDVLWFGSNQNKGLGIFSYCNYRFKVHDRHNKKLKLIIPLDVTDGQTRFTLYAVWAYNPSDRDGHYVTQVWKAIKYYDKALTNRQTMLVGDFNSNTIWDRPRRKGNHSSVVAMLEKKGIHSAYHKHFNQQQGKEQHPTLYMYRHKDKPYHIDYCFVSEDMLKRVNSIEVGDHEYWTQYSDHVPVIIAFDPS